MAKNPFYSEVSGFVQTELAKRAGHYGKFYKNKEPQLEKLINFINNLENEGNIVFVTHYVVIAAIFGQAVTSGEILIADRNLNVVGRIKDY